MRRWALFWMHEPPGYPSEPGVRRPAPPEQLERVIASVWECGRRHGRGELAAELCQRVGLDRALEIEVGPPALSAIMPGVHEGPALERATRDAPVAQLLPMRVVGIPGPPPPLEPRAHAVPPPFPLPIPGPRKPMKRATKP